MMATPKVVLPLAHKARIEVRYLIDKVPQIQGSDLSVAFGNFMAGPSNTLSYRADSCLWVFYILNLLKEILTSEQKL